MLIQKDNGRQSPIYDVSKALFNAETKYYTMERLMLAFVPDPKSCDHTSNVIL